MTASAVAFALVVAVGMLVAAGGVERRVELPNDLKSAGTAVQLSRTPEALPAILGARRGEAWVRLASQQRIDFLLVAAHTATLGLLAALLWHRGFRGLALVAGALTLAAAVCDVVENVRILAWLGDEPVSRAAPRPWALWKGGLLHATFVATAPVFLDRTAKGVRFWIGVAVVIFATRGFIVGMTGIASGTDRLVEAAGRGVVVTTVLAMLYVATHRLLAEGLLPTLDRLAVRRPFSWLTNWPSDETDEDEIERREEMTV
jgi:hypothetical protein